MLQPRLRGGPLIMGIVNVTPDSFSDGGRSADAAMEHALRLADEGADILDIGGESTRPGAEPVSVEEELARVAPVLEGVRARTSTPLSIDTMKPAVARAAIAAGASVWNDVNALRAPGAVQAAAELGCPVILMHMQGEPRTMQAAPHYGDVVAEVADFLTRRIAACGDAGIPADKIWVDPGIGFGKTLADNLRLLGAISELKAMTGRPLVMGASRKSFIGLIERAAGAAAAPADARLGGSLAAALNGARRGADMLRVHDVAATVQALRVAAALGDGA